MADVSEQSYADYGAYDIKSVKDADEDNITWVDMPKQEFFWQSEAVESIQIGEDDYYRGRTAKYSYKS